MPGALQLIIFARVMLLAVEMMFRERVPNPPEGRGNVKRPLGGIGT